MKARARWLALLALVGVLAGCSSGARGGPAPLRTDTGVTAAPCPQATNPRNGCIFLGGLSDLTDGPSAAEGRAFTRGQAAFWERVNGAGGVGGFDVDVTTYLRDGHSNAERHVAAYDEIAPHVVALAQSFGLIETLAVDGRLREQIVSAVPTSRSSRWLFSPMLFESGATHCFEAINGVDWAADRLATSTVAIVHRGDDAGEDAAAGALTAAMSNGLASALIRAPGSSTDAQEVTRRVLDEGADLVYLATDPADTGAIIDELASSGYRGALMAGTVAVAPTAAGPPAATGLRGRYYLTSPWGPSDSDTPGHRALRAALGAGDGDAATEAVTAGWISSYPVLAALRAAIENGDLTHRGFTRAIDSLKGVDYEGMLPPQAANYAAEPAEAVVRTSLIGRVDPDSSSGFRPIGGFFSGTTAQSFDPVRPCSFTVE